MSHSDNYFNYFTEIEEHFQRRRGTALLLSTLDWALIETWKDAGIPLEAVLRGIDNAFDRYDARPSKTRKVNSLAYCSQEVLAASEDMKQAAEGAAPASTEAKDTGFAPAQVAEHLIRTAQRLEQAAERGTMSAQAADVTRASASTLNELASGLAQATSASMEDLERRLTVMEEKILAALLASTSDDQLLAVRTEVDKDIAPYRSKMSGPQIEQLHKHYVHKRLLERQKLPRLSLFYM